MRLRLVTYNVRGCIGLDGRHDPERIADVLASESPDVVALQEVDVGRRRTGRIDQAGRLAARLGMQAHFVEAFPAYGIAVLSRLPLRFVRSAALPGWRGPLPVERRVALWVSVGPEHAPLQVVATHLGLIPRERERQAAALLGDEWLASPACRGPRVLCGDLNSPQRSATYRALAAVLRDIHTDGSRTAPRPTFPSFLPVARLDHILGDGVEVLSAHTSRSPLARVASDHLPLVVDLAVAG